MKIPKKYKKTTLSIEAWYDGCKAGTDWAMKTFREVHKPKTSRRQE